ncbi:hypothetical protein MSHI_05690 [Mycobacterium shinjukuense]|uniref:DOD-type homing endonuclease domain-containing protein n=1 Tax=Mycobacterium shinjukuense TaxID=398694 RepID=A0A7I7MMC5_9MYCO|nr:hypothetical protein MSHI_05690 [Mycobacterium shinjukuense]
MQRLIATGMNDCAIARQTGIPRKTVWEWRHCRSPICPRRASASSACGIDHDFTALPPAAYTYLLGLYLGDGCISRNGRVWRLRITLDDKYLGIIDRCRQAIDILMPEQRAATLRRPSNCTEVSLYSKHWPCLFTQHGPGRKHLRPIRLEPWQEVLVKEATEEFIRGLIDSDGCRVVANDRGVRSVRYHFSNRSEDILGLFSWALDLLGIPWTRPSRYCIAVYHKAATARLDEFVGPKS